MTTAWTPIAVEFEPGALNIIRTQVALVAAPHLRHGDEVGGLLCGAIVEFATVSLVRIDRVIPIVFGQSAGETRIGFSEAMAKSPDDVMGWYRSERSVKGPDSEAGRSASTDDRTWSAEFFPARQSVFLVCFPEEDMSLPGSLYLWTAGADETITGVNLGRHLVPADKAAKPREPARAPLSAPATRVPAPAFPATAASPPAFPAPASNDNRDPVPAAGSPMRSWNALVLLLAVAIIGAGAFFLIRGRPGTTAPEEAPHPPSSGIAMKVRRIGSELQVTWNPHASEVRQAAAANLAIAEGPRNLTLKLSPQQLETGQFLYRSESEDIRMDMEIVGPSGSYVESVRVAGGLPGLPAGPEIAATDPQQRNLPRINSLPQPPPTRPAPPAAKTAATVLTPEKKPVETTAASGVVPPVATPERQAPRAFVPPPGVTTTRNGVAARSDAPAPDAPQLAASVNTLTAGLPELNLPVPKAPQNAVRPAAVQAGAAPKFEEYIGPRAIRSVQPSFDASANRTIDNAFSQNHEPHEVQVEVTIDEHGRVTKASKGATTGPFAYLFVDAALAAARRWQFEPASLGGRPVPSKMTLKFAFVRNR